MKAATFIWTNNTEDDGSIWVSGYPVVGVSAAGELLIAPEDFEGEVVPIGAPGVMAHNQWIAGVSTWPLDAPREFPGA